MEYVLWFFGIGYGLIGLCLVVALLFRVGRRIARASDLAGQEERVGEMVIIGVDPDRRWTDEDEGVWWSVTYKTTLQGEESDQMTALIPEGVARSFYVGQYIRFTYQVGRSGKLRLLQQQDMAAVE